jgi:predicted nucleotidyltransferase
MEQETILGIIAKHYPSTQAVYLFGSFDSPHERAESDVDLALLLPPSDATTSTSLMLSDCRYELEDVLKREVDLISARDSDTVFQKEILAGGRQIACWDAGAAIEFEFMTLSLYQKLNEERAAILEQFAQTKRAYNV